MPPVEVLTPPVEVLTPPVEVLTPPVDVETPPVEVDVLTPPVEVETPPEVLDVLDPPVEVLEPPEPPSRQAFSEIVSVSSSFSRPDVRSRNTSSAVMILTVEAGTTRSSAPFS